ncbi:MAG: MFS transporter [Vitreimonas sp.]
MTAAATTTMPQRRRLPFTTKLFYGFGSIAYGIKENGFSTLLLLFYNQVVGLPADMVGLALMIALILDAFVDPVVGHLSDGTRTRWGRRHPFMYAAALPIGVLYLLLWHPPTGAPETTFIYLIITAIVVRSAISFYEVPSSALAPELTSDYHERTAVLGYRYMFGWLGGMVMLLATFAIFLAPTAQYPIGQLNPDGYKTYALYAAVFMTAAILISALGTHREIAHLPKPPPAAPMTLGQTLKGIAETLKNRAFLTLLLTGVFTYTNQGLAFALATYFNTFLWEFPASTLGLLTVAVMIGVALAFIGATRASRVLGKRAAAVSFTLAYVAAAITPYLLRYAGWFPSNDDPALVPILFVTTVVSHAFGVGGMILGASMMSDVVEDSQARTGKRTEGLFFAGAFFMQKCVTGFGLFFAGAILAWVAFPAQATPGAVAEGVLDRLILTYCCLKVVIGVIGATILAQFPISQADHEARVARLSELSS